ncbi:MAG TPA: acetyl-coenzyme A synthetase N-terminal domain-containing protein, partial [candidate division Zixibacteria bacterium]|nr:acetyl-coenzyme A synthetase N-terminal domain-containing protein [candidate division Zixibacteria bacterium]
MSGGKFEHVFEETRTYPPPSWGKETPTPSLDDYRARWRRSLDDPDGFWSELAEELVWDTPYERVLEWDAPFARWFVGGKLNASVQCLDKHLNTARADKTALIWIGEPGDRRTLTYRELHAEVSRFAAGLKALGITKGDRVA